MYNQHAECIMCIVVVVVVK